MEVYCRFNMYKVTLNKIKEVYRVAVLFNIKENVNKIQLIRD